MTLCQGHCLSCCLSSHSPSRSLFFLANTSDCSTCQPEDCWCTALSVPGSSSLEITAHWISTSPHPCRLSELSLKPTSSSPPFHDLYLTVCTLWTLIVCCGHWLKDRCGWSVCFIHLHNCPPPHPPKKTLSIGENTKNDFMNRGLQTSCICHTTV